MSVWDLEAKGKVNKYLIFFSNFFFVFRFCFLYLFNGILWSVLTKKKKQQKKKKKCGNKNVLNWEFLSFIINYEWFLNLNEWQNKWIIKKKRKINNQIQNFES